MVLEGFQLILDYHSSMLRNFRGLQVSQQISSRGRLDIAGVPCTISAFCLHAYCVNLMQFLGRSSSPISGEHLPPNGELLARWSSQGEEHAHAVRKRASAGGVRRTQRYAWIARAGLEHRALGPCRLAEFFLSSYGRYPEVSKAATVGQHQGLGGTLLVYLTAIVYLNKRAH